MSSDSEMAKFWDTCPPEFSHIKIEDQDTVAVVDWDEAFLKKLNEIIYLRDAAVVDYGCGGGQLGSHLHRKYHIRAYTGMDISSRSRLSAYHHLKAYNEDSKLGYKQLWFDICTQDVDFSCFKYDQVFISQATIQHFPSVEYLMDFLDNIDGSGIPYVALQFREDGMTHVSNTRYDNIEDVCFKCYTTTKYVNDSLTHYNLIWEGPIIEKVLGRYAIFKRK
jgi:SAM-dependent methyltransferase